MKELEFALKIVIAHSSLAPLDLIDKGIVKTRYSDFFTFVHFLITPKGEKRKKKGRGLSPPVKLALTNVEIAVSVFEWQNGFALIFALSVLNHH